MSTYNPSPRYPSYPPAPAAASASTPTKPSPSPRRRLRPTLRSFTSFLYHTSFYSFILIIAVLLLGSAYGLGIQAWRTGGQRRWNVVVLVGAYVALGIVSVFHVWSRILSVKKITRTMPKPYIPTKHVDLPSKVADHIMTEYSRTAVIAHISQATTGQQEGWGRPGTKWENQHFRSYILSTLPTMRQALLPLPAPALSPTPKPTPTPTPAPLSLQRLLEAADQAGDNGAIRLFVNSYARIIDKARYGRREPTEADAAAVEKVVEVVVLTMEMKRRREKERERERERQR